MLKRLLENCGAILEKCTRTVGQGNDIPKLISCQKYRSRLSKHPNVMYILNYLQKDWYYQNIFFFFSTSLLVSGPSWLQPILLPPPSAHRCLKNHQYLSKFSECKIIIILIQLPPL